MGHQSGFSRGMGWMAAAGFGCLLVNPGTSSALIGKKSAVERLVAPAADAAHIQEAYGKLPLSFIQNNGQLNSKVRFYEKSSGRTTFFTEDGVYILLSKGRKAETGKTMGERERGDLKKAHDSKPEPHAYQLVKLMPLGANKSPKIVAEDMQAGKVNYFIGNDPKKWRTNVPTYKSVVYQEAYKGIDIRFYGNNRQMEYDIVVKPGADPSQVKLAYEGVEGLKVAQTGDLEIALKDGGKLIQKKPYIYQEIEGKKRELAGRFNIAKTPGQKYAYNFEVVSYDKKQPLVIDPALAYSTYLGGSSWDYGYSIAVDSNGCAYVTGYANSYDFPTKNPIQAEKAGWEDVFVTKFNAAGSALVYSTYLGGSGNDDEGMGIAVDSNGNAYVTGYTWSDDFPMQNPIQGYRAGTSDIFVTKINAAGNALAYSTYLGGSDDEDQFGRCIAVDRHGNAYVTGATWSTDFPVTGYAFQDYNASDGNDYDAFVTKINAAGTAWEYSTYLGGSAYDMGHSIAVDGNGNVYVTGSTGSYDFPITEGAFQSYKAGYEDAFVTKINANDGTTPMTLAYSTYLGGSSDNHGRDVAVDGNGNAFVTGYTYSDDFPVTNDAIQSHNAGDSDAFVTKINAAGTALDYSTYLGGSYSERGYGIAVDGSGNACVVGRTNSDDFPTKNPIPGQEYHVESYDVFVTKINAAGTALDYSTYLGGSWNDYGYRIALDRSGSAYITGYTNSTDFPTQNPFQANNNGGANAFITKISDSCSTPASISYPEVDKSGRFIVRWSPVNGATRYVLQRSTKSNFSNAVTVYNGSSNSYKEAYSKSNKLKAGRYYYRVKAVNGGGGSTWRNGHAILIIWH